MISLGLIYTTGFQRLAVGWLSLFWLLYLLLAVFAPLMGVHAATYANLWCSSVNVPLYL